MNTIKNWPVLIGFILLSQGAGAIGSIFTASSLESWYPSLVKPVLNPPSWVFGPVWTTLFLLMGIAAYLVWQKRAEHRQARTALTLFFCQLILNTLWSIIFFGLQSPLGALAEIVLLWLAILATILAFAPISRLSAWLLAPYLAWVSFAMYLNYAIWSLNA